MGTKLHPEMGKSTIPYAQLFAKSAHDENAKRSEGPLVVDLQGINNDLSIFWSSRAEDPRCEAPQ